MNDTVRPTLGSVHDDQSNVLPFPARDTSKQTRGVHDGIPASFQFSCWLAERDGSRGYAPVGWNLASSVVCQVPQGVKLDKWLDEIKVLEKHAAADDRRAVLSWFATHYPKAMELIPAQHLDQFAAGVRQAWEEDRLVL